MKKRILFVLVFQAFAIWGFAQQTDTLVGPWKNGGKFALNFSQSSLTNWAPGGQNSLALNSFLNYFADFAKGKSLWENRLDLAYGLLKEGDNDIRKSDDKIDLSSKYGMQATKKLYYAALLGFKSQFSKGYNYPNDSMVISRFLAPGYLSIGLGMDWKPVDYFSFYLSPATARWIIVTDEDLSDIGAYGVDIGDKVRTEVGAMARLEFLKDIVKNVNLKSKLELFSNYLDQPQNVDVYWDNMFVMTINKYLSASLNLTLAYDDNLRIMDKDGKTGPRTQFKEVFGIGFTYGFGDTK
ncbi:MAG: DUF3078 domain-containing protein [Bacteroidales bacterium]|nr:DUF3078 domain-containing protein [Lentimicrobiaceae bacterium]MDD5693858.1 DUF3078 domain-containing protein [Bacteroidales bacterium]